MKNSGGLINFMLEKMGRTDIGIDIFKNESHKDSTLAGYEIRVPYGNYGHWTVGDINKKLVYNPGNTIGGILEKREVYVYAK